MKTKLLNRVIKAYENRIDTQLINIQNLPLDFDKMEEMLHKFTLHLCEIEQLVSPPKTKKGST